VILRCHWFTSQAIRDSNATAAPEPITPEELVSIARRQGVRILTSTYNEPLITSEWAVAIFREAREAGLLTAFVSNGNGTPQVLEYLRPWIDLYKVDLKSFDDRHYRQLGGRIQPTSTPSGDSTRGHLARDCHAAYRDLTIAMTNSAGLPFLSPDIPCCVAFVWIQMTSPEDAEDLYAASLTRSWFALCVCGNLPGG
jgi:hypothetical protein